MIEDKLSWWNIRAPNGDLLARIKASSLDEAVKLHVAIQQQKESGTSATAMLRGTQTLH